MRNSGKGVCLFQLIPQKQFQELCDRHQIDKGTKKLTARTHVWTLVMAYILKLESLREIESMLGIPKSTLSDANGERESLFFEELCKLVLWKIYERVRGRKIKTAIRTLLALDSTECRVNGRLSKIKSWKQRKSKGPQASLKLHAIWNVEEEWIDDFKITTGRVHDATAVKLFKIRANCTYIFDRAYNELLFWWNIVERESHFVSRLKKNSMSQWRHKKLLAEKINEVGVLSDGPWKPSYPVLRKNPQVPKDFALRHIVFKDPETKKVFDFITSDFDVSAQEIADIYRKRWAVELLFRWMKSHLRVRSIDARSPNAVRVLIITAVLVQLLVRLYRLMSQFPGSLWECLRKIQTDWAKAGFPADPPKTGETTPFVSRSAPRASSRLCYA